MKLPGSETSCRVMNSESCKNVMHAWTDVVSEAVSKDAESKVQWMYVSTSAGVAATPLTTTYRIKASLILLSLIQTSI